MPHSLQFRDFSGYFLYIYLVLFFLTTPPSQAVTLTWKGPATRTWTTSATNIWTSGTAWSNTTPDSAIFGATGLGTVTLASSGITANALTFQVTGYTLTSTGTLTLAGTAPSVTMNTGTTTISAALGGTGGFTKSGAGTLVLSNLTNTGLTRVSNGILEVNGRTGDSPYEIDSAGTLRIGYTNGGAYANTAMTIHGAGTAATTGLYLKGGTSYNASGGIVLADAPTIIRQYGTGLAAIGTFDIWGNGMTVSAAASGSSTDSNVNFISRGYGMSINVAAGANTATGDFILNGALDVDHSGNGFYKRGAGSLRLNAAATANNRNVRVVGGSIITGVNGALGVNAKIEVNTGAKLVLNGTTQTTSSLLAGGGSIVGASATESAMNVVQVDATTFSGLLGGAGANENNLAFSKAGTSTLTLTGNNTYTGATTVSAGTLKLGDGGTSGSLSGTSGVSLSATNAVLETQRSDTLVLSMPISGSGDLQVSNTATGKTVLTSASNTYSGETTVASGSLQVGASGAGVSGTGATIIANNSTILGSGIVRGSSVTLAAGARLTPGDTSAASSHSILTFTPVSTGTYAFQASSITTLGISTANVTDPTFGGNSIGTPGYNSYLAGLTGLGSGSHDLLVFNGTAGSSLTMAGNIVVSASGFTPQKGQVFNLIDWVASVGANFSSFNVGTNFRDGSGDNASQFDLPDLSGTGLVWDVSRFTTSGIIVVVPEPGRITLLVIGAMGLVFRRRRNGSD